MNTNPCNPFERNHSKYPADNVHAEKPTHKYYGSITHSEVTSGSGQTPKSIRIIDDAIVVESVDQKTRAAAINYFDTAKQQASFDSQLHTTDYYKGVAVTVLGIGLGLGCGPFMPAALPVAGGILGAALSILGITKAINNNSAINAIDTEIGNIERLNDQWKDPVEEIIHQRKLAGTQGFQYVYRNNLKGKIVHAKEVQELWLNDFSKLISGRQNLHQICNDNLLGKDRVAFSWNSPRLPDIEIAGRHFSASALDALSMQFEACRTSFKSFEAGIEHDIQSLKNQKAQLKKEIQDVRSRWLYPSECQYAQSKQEASYLRDNALRPYLQEKNLAIEKVRQSYRHLDQPLNDNERAHNAKLERMCDEEIQHICRQYDSHPAVLNIHKAYERDRRMCELLYNQSRLAVNSFFDNRLRQLENAFNDARERIEEQRIAGHQNIKDTMDKILGNATNPLSYVNTTMPAIHRNWRLPAVSREPSWNEVYGQAPGFQSSFADVISEYSWNLFWSGQGFGRFSASPTSSWSSFTQDRSAFPFKQQWFNLHNLVQDPQGNCAQAPREGMFMRAVKVPTPPVRTTAEPVRPAPQPAFPQQERVVPGTRPGFASANMHKSQRVPEPEPERVSPRSRPGFRTADMHGAIPASGSFPQNGRMPPSTQPGYRTADKHDSLRVPVGNATSERRGPTPEARGFASSETR